MSQQLTTTTNNIPIRINQAIAQGIDAIATRRQMKVEILINEILKQYVVNQPSAKKQDGATFLLSLAGMFNSGTSNTSENVHSIVADFILKEKGLYDSPN